MDLHKKYELTRVINACGKMTHLAGAIVLPPIADAAREAMNHFFDLDELQAAAGRVIAEAAGAESGCVTACTAAGITLSVAATMTGHDIARVLQLPDTEGMPNRVLIQKGHCVNYGHPVTQAIRLAGAEAVEVGVVNRCTEALLRRVAALAREYGVPVIVDGAAQDLRLKQLIADGADIVITSAHKFLCSTTGGVVAGRRDLVDAIYLQNRGIGRPMKAGKEAIVGAMAALEYRASQDMTAWTAEQDRKVQRILDRLAGVPGLALGVDPDPNGCPFSRARLAPDPDVTGHSAHTLTAALAEGDPTVVARSHHADEGFIYLDAIEMTDDEIDFACDRVKQILAAA
jgi:L-seryl-tRNA(Ser) seleniumtransferase